MLTRRQFLVTGVLAGAGLMIPAEWAQQLAQAQKSDTGSAPESLTGVLAIILDPTTMPKYVTQLISPPTMPRTSEITLPDSSLADYYEIAMRQFTQYILPASMGLDPTPVWSYGATSTPATFNYPAFTIEATWDKPVRVKWINDLVDESGRYLPHLLWVDKTVHWANPPGPPDMEGMI
jgi:spore coat protein A